MKVTYPVEFLRDKDVTVCRFPDFDAEPFVLDGRPPVDELAREASAELGYLLWSLREEGRSPPPPSAPRRVKSEKRIVGYLTVDDETAINSVKVKKLL